MRSKRKMRAAFVVTLGAGAVLGACGGISTSGPGDGDGGSADGGGDGGNPASCPATPPARGGACDVPSDVSCTYGSSCSPTIYSCSQGAWVVAISNPPAPVCPATLPSGPCPCFPPSIVCSYPMGTCAGQPRSEIASCSNGEWIVGISTCNPPAPDASAPPDASFVDVATDATHD